MRERPKPRPVAGSRCARCETARTTPAATRATGRAPHRSDPSRNSPPLSRGGSERRAHVRAEWNRGFSSYPRACSAPRDHPNQPTARAREAGTPRVTRGSLLTAQTFATLTVQPTTRAQVERRMLTNATGALLVGDPSFPRASLPPARRANPRPTSHSTFPSNIPSPTFFFQFGGNHAVFTAAKLPDRVGWWGGAALLRAARRRPPAFPKRTFR